MRTSDDGLSSSGPSVKELAKIYVYDWVILLVIAAVDLGVNSIEPFHRYVGKGMMSNIMYPMKDNTIPFWAVPFPAVLFPFCIYALFFYIRKDIHDLHQATLGNLFSVLITGVLTDSIKIAVGRPRPNFFWRCFPDGKPIYHHLTGDVVCNGDKSVIKEGYKSFPSGHTSWTFAGLVYFSLYISGKIRAFDKSGHAGRLCLVFFPILVATLMGVSRIDDYWHHWEDVVTGAFLGSIVAFFCYLQFFPPPYDVDGWGPHSYFHMISRSENSGRCMSDVNPNTSHLPQHSVEIGHGYQSAST